MKARWRFLVLAAAWGAALGACASGGATTGPPGASPMQQVAAEDAPAATWEPWPPPGRTDVPRPEASGGTVEIVCPDGGMPALDLVRLVSKETGIAVSYDSSPQGKIKVVRIEWAGTLRVPRLRLLDAARALLAHHSLVLVPVGPEEGTETWMVLDMANPMVKSRPTWIPEEEVLAYADCDGLYVCTTLRIRDTVDTQRVRTALTPLATTTAGIGRVQDVPGTRHVILGDFAPVVAAMKRLVDEINRLAEPPPYPPPLRIPGAKPAGDAAK